LTGQREKFTYRVVRSSARKNESFLPAQGVGAGVGEGLAIVLNRIVKGPLEFRTLRKTVVGIVIDETSDYVIVERNEGRRLRIAVSDIIERTKFA